MITLVLGGARSGKSAVAERLASRCDPPVTYVATLQVGDDVDLSRRVAAHRARRPASWRTVEAGDDLAATMRALPGTVLLDSLGPWLGARPGFAVDANQLCAALSSRAGDCVIVTDEVGLGVHPATEAGRDFRDALGSLNQAVAAVADRALLVLAGRVLSLDSVF